ncbi:unnamed protein product [Gadus morhua 'NCC']
MHKPLSKKQTPCVHLAINRCHLKQASSHVTSTETLSGEPQSESHWSDASFGRQKTCGNVTFVSWSGVHLLLRPKSCSAGRAGRGDAIRGERRCDPRAKASLRSGTECLTAPLVDGLRQQAYGRFLRHFEQVVEFSEEFLAFSAAKLAEVAGVVELNVSHEEVVLEAVADMPEERTALVIRLLSKMSEDFLADYVANHTLVRASEERRGIVAEAPKDD